MPRYFNAKVVKKVTLQLLGLKVLSYRNVKTSVCNNGIIRKDIQLMLYSIHNTTLHFLQKHTSNKLFSHFALINKIPQ